MNIMKSWLLAVVCSIALSSCSLFEEPDSNENKPKKVRLSTIKYYFPDQSSNQIKFIYNDADRLIRKDWYTIQNEVDFYEEYIYQQGLLTTIKRSGDHGSFAEDRFVLQKRTDFYH